LDLESMSPKRFMNFKDRMNLLIVRNRYSKVGACKRHMKRLKVRVKVGTSGWLEAHHEAILS
jgi:hypothetical protein